MIGSLMYLTAFRPDIMFTIYACARFQVTPKTSYIYAVKRIFRYLKGQPKLGLWYPRDSPFDLEAFSDSDYARASLDMKSLTGGSGPRCQVTILAGAKAQTRFEAASKQSNDPPLSRVNTLGSGEDSTKLNELMELCIKLSDILWATPKVKTVNGERQLQALVDKKKVIITETSIRSDLNLEDAGGTNCLPTDTIFEELARMGASTEPMTEKETNEESVPTHSYDPSQSGEDRMQLHKLMNLCTKLSDRVLALETTKTTQALEIASLKSRVKKLEKKASKRTHKFKRLYRERSIEDIDKDAEVSLVDETQRRSDDTEMFDTDALIGDEVFAENDMTEKEHDVIPKEVSATETLTTAGIKIPVSIAAPSTTVVSPPVITEVEITLAQTLAKLKNAGETTTRTPTSVSSSSIRDKRKAKMVEPEVPLNKKDQIRLDEELARRLDAEEQEAVRLERENVELQEQATLEKIEEWDNVQAMMDADYELCKRLQEQEQGELTIKEKSKLFMELMNERKKHFAALRAQENQSKPPTKAQKRNTMSTYLKNMAGYKHNQLKSKSYDEIQEMFDKEIKRVNTFVDMNSEVVKGNEARTKESSKRAGHELESDMSKKQKIDEHVEVKKDDQEEAEMKRHIKIVKDDEVAIDAIPLATKPSVIVDYKIDKDGRMGYFKLIRVDGSLKRYSSMIKMLLGIDREDLETLWKLVKAKHENTRPEKDYERVLWGD
ncbi:hypothetical protein Tco_1343088 [Tanacetum coccineum]